MNSFFKTLTILLAALAFSGVIFQSNLLAAKAPNIVFIFADDLGYGDLGCYGHPYAKTPHLDQLAKEGTRFTQAYVTGVTCNPSRTGLMTGLYPARFAKYAADYGFGTRVSITELLNKAGYATGHFGKWHIGPKSSAENGQYGIDVVQVIGKSQGKKTGRDDDLTAAAIDFMKQKAGKQPFYLNIWGHSTHFPVNVPKNLSGQFSSVKLQREDFSKTMQHKFDECLQIGGNLDQSMHQYLGDVWSIDQNVGRILKAIDELGICENTLVVFSSDHGPAPVILGKNGARKFSNNMLGYAGIFKGGKHTHYEGGTRVPFIIRWPGHVKADQVDSENVISFIDWMPTLAKIAGVEDLPKQMDGEDVSGIWLGKNQPRQTPLFWKSSSTGSRAVIREGKWKLHGETRKAKQELYDLSVDPSESENLVARHPKIAKQLQRKLDKWIGELPKAYDKK